MVNIAKLGDSAIKFTFTDNYRYLHNGEIEVPLNSLILVVDESDMVTFKKIDGDPFVSFLISDSNFESKDTLIYFYKTSMVGGTGGSESGITSGDVESMISASLEDYYDIDEIDAALSGKADTSSVYTKGEVDAALSGKADTSAVTEAITAAVSGKQDTLIAGSGITISGNVISAEGGNNVIELTQAQYDALVTAGTVAADTFYIITDATEINISDYYTSAQTQSAINAAVSGKADTSAVYTKSEVDTALSGKQDTLVAGDNITISGNVISADGGGKAVIGGTNISITTGETADTINCTLPISAGTGSQSIIAATQPNYPSKATANGAIAFNGYGFHPTYASGVNSLAQGSDTKAQGDASHAEGNATYAIGYASHSEGSSTSAMTNYSHAEGGATKTTNSYEHASGLLNISVSASTTFGNSGNTLFSVGNGYNTSNTHNAFEVRQNGEIYIADTNDTSTSNYYEKPMIKLQDALGGGGGVSESAFTVYSAATDARISEDEEVTAAALNALNDGKQDTLIAGSGITISGNVISAIGGGGGIDSGTVQTMIDGSISGKADTSAVTVAINAAVSGKADSSAVTEISSAVSGKMDTSAFTSYSAATDARISEDEEVTAAALNALNDRVDAIDITVDDALDATSENPVQNKVIYAVIGDIESLLSNI